MERVTQFQAGFYRITTARDGESRVVFEVPLSEMPSVTRLYLCLETPLLVTVDRVSPKTGT
jgi:hypothetical protein